MGKNVAVCCGLILSVVLGVALGAWDMPLPYATVGMQVVPFVRPVDWNTSGRVFYRDGVTSHAWNHSTDRVPLLHLYDGFNIAALGVGLSSRSALVQKYWNNDQLFKPPGSGAAIDFGDFVCTRSCDGEMSCSARYQHEQVDLLVRQNILDGFFVQLSLPCRHMVVDKIDYRYCGHNSYVANFIQTELDVLLKDYGICPFKTSYDRSGCGDLLVSAGWTGYTEHHVGMLDLLGFTMECGLIAPVGAREHVNHLFGLPLGYQGHWGCGARLQLDTMIGRYFWIGATGGVIAFMPRSAAMRISTDRRQTAWLVLEKARVRKDQGSIWDVELYVGVRYGALTGIISCSFVRQDAWKLKARNQCVLNRLVNEGVKRDPVELYPVNDIINSNRRLQGWEQYALHGLFEINGAVLADVDYVPTLSVTYDLQLSSKHCFDTRLWGGSIGLSCSWSSF